MLPYIIAGVVALLIVALAALGYVKAPPDTAFIISGFRKPRILIGKAGIRIVLFAGKDDGFCIKMWVFMGIKITQDQAGLYLQCCQMLQTAIAKNNVVIRLQYFAEEIVIAYIRVANNDAAFQHIIASLAYSPCRSNA